MHPHKKTAFILLILLIVLLGSVFLLIATIRSTNIAYGLGSPSEQLSFPQKMRYSLQVYLNRENLVNQVTPSDKKKSFVIEQDESVQSVCNHLGLLYPHFSSSLCRNYLVYRGLDRKIEPGTYSIPTGFPSFMVYNHIADPMNRNRNLVIFAGWRIEEIAEAVNQLGLRYVNGQSLLDALKNPEERLVSQFSLSSGQSLEGYILPGQYLLEREVDMDSLLTALTSPLSAQMASENLAGRAKAMGLHLKELLTLASIIQRETLRSDEMPVIASVFLNRLAQDMPLQTDPTVQYALGFQESWWKAVLTKADLQVNSPYNTYLNKGLPPGPIASPGMDAIKAVLNAEKTDFLFFRAKCDGSSYHHFSVTYQEHLDKACP
ncbi:MAG: endolytic transglycosylase MltG [Anaerolineaceae bacterium]|nr:endolytic transglycosylase MltG [Anaerolineaceae bacterium]